MNMDDIVYFTIIILYIVFCPVKYILLLPVIVLSVIDVIMHGKYHRKNMNKMSH